MDFELREPTAPIEVEYVRDPDTGIVSVLVDHVQVVAAPAQSEELQLYMRAIGATVARLNAVHSSELPDPFKELQ